MRYAFGFGCMPVRLLFGSIEKTDMYSNDKRTVITLDAGGTNFVFGAIRANDFVVDPITLPSNAYDLGKCLQTIVEGFQQVMDRLDDDPVAISFAFPGPADYPHGIIGGFLPNFPSFSDGVALGDFLKDRFDLPVWINNDADLFAYGEALAGALPETNARLEAAGSSKRFHNLLGFTWGTGFGFGMAVDNRLHIGDNSCVEIYCLRNRLYPDSIVEDSVSIRAVRRVYGELSGEADHGLDPRQIYEIAAGDREGDREAAIGAFTEFGRAAGDAFATVASLLDGLIIVGGGLTGARRYIMPALLAEMRGTLGRVPAGERTERLPMSVYDLDDPVQFERFARGESRLLRVYGSERSVTYDPEKRIGIVFSKLGASRAVSLGAYAYALNELDNNAAAHAACRR